MRIIGMTRAVHEIRYNDDDLIVLEFLAAKTGKDPPEVICEIIRACLCDATLELLEIEENGT